MFVQIGSHNGIDGDPLARWIDSNPWWRGIMVEPVPEQFEAYRNCGATTPGFDSFVRRSLITTGQLT